MFHASALNPNSNYNYQGNKVSYLKKQNSQFYFQDEQGQEIRLTLGAVHRDIWQEIDLSKLESRRGL